MARARVRGTSDYNLLLPTPVAASAPTGSRGNTYSPFRLKLVLFLLTAATLPVVIGSSVLIYYYLRFSVMVERRLQGERWLIPARLYARPIALRNGMVLSQTDLVKILNGLKYEEKQDIPAAGGQFAAGKTTVTFAPPHPAGGARSRSSSPSPGAR